MSSPLLDAPVHNHLKQVYTCLSMATFSAAIGAYIHVFTDLLQGNILTTFISIGLFLALCAIPHESKNVNLRVSLLMGFAFFSGLGLGPLLDYALILDPSIVATAFLSTCLVFVCFSASALFNRNKSFLYIGGFLGSACSLLLLLSIANIFFQSVVIFQTYIYFGLVVFCAFVMYDTQAIIEKRQRGDTDYIKHSLDLFMDFLNIFRHILIILMQSQDNKRRKKDRD